MVSRPVHTRLYVSCLFLPSVPAIRAPQRRRWTTRFVHARYDARRRSGGNDRHDAPNDTTDSPTNDAPNRDTAHCTADDRTNRDRARTTNHCTVVRRGGAAQSRHIAANAAAAPTGGIVTDAFRHRNTLATPTANSGNAPRDRAVWRRFAYRPGANGAADSDTTRKYTATDRHRDKPTDQYTDGYADGHADYDAKRGRYGGNRERCAAR
jgi:hypothetical protein